MPTTVVISDLESQLGHGVMNVTQPQPEALAMRAMLSWRIHEYAHTHIHTYTTTRNHTHNHTQPHTTTHKHTQTHSRSIMVDLI